MHVSVALESVMPWVMGDSVFLRPGRSRSGLRPSLVPGAQGLRGRQFFFVAEPSGALGPGCSPGVSLLLPPSLHCPGTLRNIFLFERMRWVWIFLCARVCQA